MERRAEENGNGEKKEKERVGSLVERKGKSQYRDWRSF